MNIPHEVEVLQNSEARHIIRMLGISLCIYLSKVIHQFFACINFHRQGLLGVYLTTSHSLSRKNTLKPGAFIRQNNCNHILVSGRLLHNNCTKYAYFYARIFC